MIFKVSFKETEKSPSKVIQKAGRTTTVLLRGVVNLPTFWRNLPEEIVEWVACAKKVEIYENIVDNTLTVYSSGEAKCNPEDKYDSILGERIAEARAKYCIYKFFYDLSLKLYDYYDRLLFGEIELASQGAGSCIAQDMKKYEGLCIRESHHIGELLANNGNE